MGNDNFDRAYWQNMAAMKSMMEDSWKTMKFIPLTHSDYYGEIDSLDGKHELPEGNYVLKFPDDTMEQHFVRIARGRGSAQIDMNNHPDEFPTRKAYITTTIHDVEAIIYLRKSGIMIGVDD